MKTTYLTNLDSFRHWRRHARPGDLAVYHTDLEPRRNHDMFTFARELSDLGSVMLHQRRIAGGSRFEWQAQRMSAQTASILDRVSALIPAPYNPYAHEV